MKRFNYRKSVAGIVAANRIAIVLVLPMFILAGCIKNDIPYPRIQPDIVEIDAEGLLKPAEIDTESRMVTMTFEESVDISKVNVTHYALSEGASIVEGNLDAPIDLTEYYILTLRLYQNYDWAILGVQNIERYFTVENQIGETIIDVIGKRVVVRLPSASGLENVKVLAMKIGPKGAITSPALEGKTINLAEPLEVTVDVYGRREEWEIHGELVESTVNTERVDAWSKVAWVYGSGVAGRDNGVEYKAAGDSEWTRVPQEWVTHNGGSFYARIKGLAPMTVYKARAYSDTECGAEMEFTTGDVVQVPNMSFDEWHKLEKVWNPWAEGTESYWDTGNKGATTLGESNTVPTDISATGTGKAAQLSTKFVGIGVVGKLAAGNIFAGSYVRTVGTNGVLSFGRPFTERPTKLSGMFKYSNVPISHASNEFSDLKGRPDTCIVWCALIDSPEPCEIRTDPSNRKLFDENASNVVAYGRFQTGDAVANFTPFEVVLNYRATNRVPKYILLVASASKYGDYFTGGDGSVLTIDELELDYDY